MPSFALALLLAAGLQAPAEPKLPAGPGTQIDVPRIDASLGPCTTDFTVIDAAGKPVFGVSIKVRIRYGFMNMKRMDLDVATNTEGKARVTGLPAAAKPLAYEAAKADLKATVEQNVATTCKATFELTLK